ncbi:hypothetical protein AB0368_25930 [Actinoplanes sp. NPDC051475]|uniref:hypothetical protein n=1 Tax=Actinoplanes sp. NPDC051475 TaxID=3157225 RepID=UPI003450CAF7
MNRNPLNAKRESDHDHTPRTAILAAGAVLATTSLAGAATASLDLAVGTSPLEFQPPATLPDSGVATVTITNFGTTRPSAASIEVDTVSRLHQVTVNGLPCRIVTRPGGTDVARCAIPSKTIPVPQRSVTMALVVEINSSPGNCSCAPLTVRLLVTGDSNPSNNVAVAPIVR